MIKKTITYEDYDGATRTEDFYFNLSKAELLEMEYTTSGGMQKYLERIVNTQDSKLLLETFKSIIMKAYGEKTLDGRRFVKSKELSDNFVQSPAYSELFMELIQDADAASSFINGVVPGDLAAQAAEKKFLANQ